MLDKHEHNTILLLADISGFTQFTKEHTHTVAGSHGKQIIVRLLKALIKSAKPPLRVAELEGDAVFFYARASKGNIDEVAAHVKEQMLNLFSAFKAELQAIDLLTTCGCDACDHVHDLQLKEVVHLGNADIEQIGRFEKFFGLDVIIVHRLLKNSIPAKEYVLTTKPMLSSMKDFFGLRPERRSEMVEGIGEIDTIVFYPGQLHRKAEEYRAHSRHIFRITFIEKFAWRVQMSYHTVLDRLKLVKTTRALHGMKA